MRHSLRISIFFVGGLFILATACDEAGNATHEDGGVADAAPDSGLAEGQCDPGMLETMQIALETVYEEAAWPSELQGVVATTITADDRTCTVYTGVSTESPYVEIQPEMLLGTGSCTKSYTAAMIHLLAEEGALELDDLISDHLPLLASYPNVDPAVTISQLLDHTSGVAETSSVMWLLFQNDPEHLFTPEEILEQIPAPEFTPGTSWSYSNTNYYLLTMIVEKATSKQAAAAFRDHLLDPLGLEETFFAPWENVPDGHQLAHGWTGNLDNTLESGNAFYSWASGAGAIFATAEDLARWLKRLFSGDVVTQDSIDAMTSFNAYAIGDGIGSWYSAGTVVWGHLGIVPGYYSIMLFDPENEVSVAILTNRDSNVAGSMVTEASQVLHVAALGN